MKQIFSIMFFILMLFVVPMTALAVDYSIDQMQIEAKLQKNGDVHVVEEQTYSFTSKFNGITRELIPKVATEIVDVEAFENNNSLKVEQEDTLYKIYRSGKDETVIFNLSYTIKNGVEVFNDIAQFAWPFFDTNNESDYKLLDIFIYPPETTNDVIAFGYDAAEETATVNDDGTVHFSMGTVKSGTSGDIHVGYDPALFSNATNVHDKQMRAELLAAKAELTEKRLKFESRKETASTIVPIFVLVFGLLLLILLFIAWRKKQQIKFEVERQYITPYFVPEEVMSLPATISYMKFGVIQAEVLTAALLDLVRKGFVERLADDKFKVIKKQTDFTHEQILLDWLFYKIGDDGEFCHTHLENYLEQDSNQTAYYQDYVSWQQAVQAEVKSYRLINKNTKLRLLSGVLSLPVILLTINAAMYDQVFYAVISGFLSLTFILFAIVYQSKTVLGAKITKDWTGFQKKYIEIEEKEWGDLVNDEQQKAFIYNVGINNTDVQKKHEKMLKEPSWASQSGSNTMSYLLMASLISPQFSSAEKVSASTTSTTSIGGGTGVGGGGGGSGAF